MAKSKIYVANYSGHDISKAFEYTDLSPQEAQINLTEGNIDIFNTDRLIYTLKEKIRASHPEDLLLLCGSGIINSIASCQWLEKHKVIRFLIYNVKEQRYVFREVTHQQIIDL